LGVDRMSLNFAVCRSAFEDGARIGAGAVARAWRRLLLVASRWWQLETLYRSNARYRPEWVPRFLCFSERRDLVKISMASAIAEGFLTLPGASRRLATAGSAPAGTPPGIPPHAGTDGASPDRPASGSVPGVPGEAEDPVEAALAAHLA